jgi:hypothetical protein
MRDVALLGIIPGMCTAFLDRGRGRLACAACLGNLSASALTILGETHQQKNITKNTMRCMDGPKVIHHHHHHHHDFRATRQSEGAMRRGVVAWRGMAWPWP